MPGKTWVLIDSAQHDNSTDLRLDAGQLPGAPPDARILKRTRRSGLSAGVEEVLIHNGRFEFSLLPTRGMGLWRAWLADQTLGWQAPIAGPVHPRFVPLTEPSGLGWLDGFDEWICRCGLVSNGAPDFNEQGQLLFPLHGRIANLPARQVQVTVDGDQISVSGVVEECRFHFQKLQLSTTITTRFNQAGLEIVDQVANRSANEAEMQMLYHCNFGAPLLSAGAEVLLPAERIVPRNDWAADALGHWSTYSEPTPGMTERVYFMRMLADNQRNSLALLRSADRQHGVSLHWNVEQLPCFSLWKNETAFEDGYVTGLEPGTNFPNPRRFETDKGRVVRLGAGQSQTMKLGIAVHETADALQAVEAQIRAIQINRPAELVERPDPEWCAPP
jgi:galactose mutarotase-like enzyme